MSNTVDTDNNFSGIFYQDRHMGEMYQSFPDVLLVDATLQLLDLQYPLYLLLTIDGNGVSEIVAIFIVKEESKPMIEAAVKIFQKYNPAFIQTNLIISDQDFVERDVFTRLFPNSSLHMFISYIEKL